MAYANILEKSSNCGTFQQRMYVVNVDNTEEDLNNEILNFLRSRIPAPGVDIKCTWEYYVQKNPKVNQKTTTTCFRQMEEVDYLDIRFYREDYGNEIDCLTGYDYVDFNTDLVSLMKEEGWKLTQFFRDGFKPTRQWVFYKGPMNDPMTC